MKDKKPHRVGQSNGLYGLLLGFLIPFFTVTGMTDPKPMPNGQTEGMIQRAGRVIKSHRWFFIMMAAGGLVGGVSLGRLMPGGRKLAEAGEFSELDKL